MKKQVKLGLTTLLVMTLCAYGGPKNAATGNTAKANANQAQASVESQDQSNASVGQVQANVQAVDEKAYLVSLIRAVGAFKKGYPQARLTEVSFEQENGNYVYEIKGKDSNKDYELQVHAVSEGILEQGQENENNPMIQVLDLSQVKIERETTDAALAAARGRNLYVKSWSLEVENKQPVYEVPLVKDNQDSLDVKLDTKTLEVLDLDV